MSLILIHEIAVEGKRLGRHIDSRAVEHRAVSGPPPLANELRSVKHPSSPNLPLNQQDTSACTAHAYAAAVNTVPHWAPGAPAVDQAQVWPIYSLEEQDLFGSPYPPTDQGGSGQAVCEAAENLGFGSSFNYAANIHEILLSLVLRPGIAGVNWYTSFDVCPTDTGIVEIAPDATVRGGHEICATELVVPAGVTVHNMLQSLDQIQVWFWQSWGLQFGLNDSGRFGMTAATLSTLLSEGGDFKVPRTLPGWVAPTA